MCGVIMYQSMDVVNNWIIHMEQGDNAPLYANYITEYSLEIYSY